MSTMTLTAIEPDAADLAALERPFLKTLVRIMRAEDSYGAWESKSDASVLRPFLLTKEERQEIPLMGDPDPDTLWRVEKFYTSIGLTIEQEVGVMAGPMMKMSHEGFGRVVLIAGRLVVLSKHLRDVHRFGFASLAKLADEGEKHVAKAVAAIEAHPSVARD
jgi:probable nitrogen fixation protein